MKRTIKVVRAKRLASATPQTSTLGSYTKRKTLQLQQIGELVGPGEFVSQDTLVANLKKWFNSDPDG